MMYLVHDASQLHSLNKTFTLTLTSVIHNNVTFSSPYINKKICVLTKLTTPAQLTLTLTPAHNTICNIHTPHALANTDHLHCLLHHIHHKLRSGQSLLLHKVP